MNISTSSQIATLPIYGVPALLTPAVSKAQDSVTQQESTIVTLSTRGLALSRGDSALSTGERNESAIAESAEPISIQYLEGELKRGRLDTTAIHG